MRTRLLVVRLSLLKLAALAACTLGQQTHGEPLVCQPFSTRACACAKGIGSVRCAADGSFEACRCVEEVASSERDAASTPMLVEPDGAAASLQDAESVSAADSAKLPCDVAALLQKHCRMCHGVEPAFAAPMSLVSWDDLQKQAPRTSQRITRELALERMKSSQSPMPPAPLARPSAAEIDVLERWIAAGASPGTCQSAADVGLPDGGIPPLRGVTKPADCEATYALTAHSTESAEAQTKFQVSSKPARDGNQYHCFYFKPPYADGSGLLWFEPILDDIASVHHFILYATDNAKNAPGSSGPCNGAGVDTYFVAGWAPGADNTALPSDVSLALPSGPNAGLILEVHYYNNTGAAKLDASGVRFCTAKQSARAHTAGVHFLGSEGICVPPASRGFEVRGVCAPRSDLGEIHITGVWPHMHQRARRQRLLITRRDGASEVLHDQPFDFNAQLFYPKPDVVLRAGDRIETTCFYDNESNRQVSYGERTEDEMCYAFVTAWPAGALSATPLLGGSLLQVNRCGEDLSILASCNGLDDSPTLIVHPP
jgi:Copper type II ascorbate-dependent monooxygenase, C-terminal domain/Copper type II ascorbate-dependent monooxygenase, N-terminal domain